MANRGDWQTITDMRSVERIWLRPSLDEIFDLKWSPDSAFIIAGALDNKVSQGAFTPHAHTCAHTHTHISAHTPPHIRPHPLFAPTPNPNPQPPTPTPTLTSTL